jgi:hypothetical protein
MFEFSHQQLLKLMIGRLTITAHTVLVLLILLEAVLFVKPELRIIK